MSQPMLFAVALLLGAQALGADAQTVEKRTLTLAGAKSILAAAESEAKRLGAPGGAIAVVDDGGNVLLVERLEGTFPASATVSIGKARTAALFRKPSGFFEESINKGRFAMTALPDSLFTPLQGGVPIIVDGQVVGAVGVSGASSAAQDEQISTAAASSLQVAAR